VSVIRLARDIHRGFLSLSLSWHFTKKKKMSDDEEESQELVMIAEKARSLLNRKERQVLSHCCHSYLSGRTGVHHFVDSLLRLLPTPDKVNCFLYSNHQKCVSGFVWRSRRPDCFVFYKIVTCQLDRTELSSCCIILCLVFSWFKGLAISKMAFFVLLLLLFFFFFTPGCFFLFLLL
jgi:hypothetical protein